MDAHIAEGRPRFEAWRAEIATARDAESLLGKVRQYLSLWVPEALSLLPKDLAATALSGPDAIYARALLASRADLDMKSDDPRHDAVRDMALVMAAAASRLTELDSLRSASRLKPTDAALPAGWRGALEAEVRQKADS